MKKIRQYGFWISLAGAIILFIQTICESFGIRFESDIARSIVTAFCGILVVLGVLIKTEEPKEDIDSTEGNILV